MTHEQIKALDTLIAAVESGAVISMDARCVCLCLGWKFPDMRIKWLLSSEIGSLDAAKALHDALLPGWHYRITRGKHTPEAIVQRDIMAGEHSSAEADSPARAWLIAILKAYRAQVEA